MGHLLAFRAAVDGKPPVNNLSSAIQFIVHARRLLIAAVAFLLVALTGTASHAEGAFVGMAGNWSGSGTITLDDASIERIRCRATYAVRTDGNGLNQTLTCASDSFRINLASNIVAQGSSLSGTWSESSRNVSGSLEGRGGGGNFQVVANGPGFSASIALTTKGNKQSVVIKSDSVFRVTSISLTRS